MPAAAARSNAGNDPPNAKRAGNAATDRSELAAREIRGWPRVEWKIKCNQAPMGWTVLGDYA
jgi:hypothetical protein